MKQLKYTLLSLLVCTSGMIYTLPLKKKRGGTTAPTQKHAPQEESAQQKRGFTLDKLSVAIEKGIAEHGDTADTVVMVPLDGLFAWPEQEKIQSVIAQQTQIVEKTRKALPKSNGKKAAQLWDECWNKVDALMIDQILPHVQLSQEGKIAAERLSKHKNVRIVAFTICLVPHSKVAADAFVEHFKQCGLDFALQGITQKNAPLVLEESGATWLRYQSGICFFDASHLLPGMPVARSLAKRGTDPFSELFGKAGYTPKHVVPNLHADAA